MKRRHFLHATGSGMAAASPLVHAAMDCYVQRLPGVQLFTIRDALAADPDAALGNLAAEGIEEVELFGLDGSGQIFGLPIAQFRTLLDKHRLSMSCTHIGADNLDVAAVSRDAHGLGVDTVVLGAAPGFIQFVNNEIRIQGPQSREEIDQLARLLNSLGRQFRTEGLLFGYHNHHVEFYPLADELIYNTLMWNTDPQFVRAELDIGWIALAGADYLDCLDRFGNRTLACHLKDFNGSRISDSSDFRAAAANLVPPGDGTVNFTAVLEKMDYYGIRHGFVEIDQSSSPFAAIGRGNAHLQVLRNCP